MRNLGLGLAASTARQAEPDQQWITRTPLAAADQGLPCLTLRLDDGSLSLYYQTTPKENRASAGPYVTLAKPLGGGVLRPDLWLILDTPTATDEVLIECKYSLNTGYVREGITQVLAYYREYTPRADVRRVHMVVCPESVLDTAHSWEAAFAVGTPRQLRELVHAALRRETLGLLHAWSG